MSANSRRLVWLLAAPVALLLLTLMLNNHWTVCVRRGKLVPPAPPPGAQAAAPSFFTAEEILYFTRGEGDRMKHERRLVDYVRGQIARPSGRMPLLSGYPPVMVDERGGKHYSEMGQSQLLDDLLKAKRDGFYVECGAATGEQWSNSLFFEVDRNWTGLLVDGNPQYYESLLKMQRNAYVLTTCLSPVRTPTSLKYKIERGRSGIDALLSDSHRRTFQEAPLDTTLTCFPLQTVLDAIGVTRVNLLMLDVEGAELEILMSLAWERLRVDYILLEYGFSPRGGTKPETLRRLNSFRNFLTNLTATGGYEIETLVPMGATEADGQDVVFRRRDVV